MARAQASEVSKFPTPLQCVSTFENQDVCICLKVILVLTKSTIEEDYNMQDCGSEDVQYNQNKKFIA